MPKSELQTSGHFVKVDTFPNFWNRSNLTPDLEQKNSRAKEKTIFFSRPGHLRSPPLLQMIGNRWLQGSLLVTQALGHPRANERY